MYIRVQVAASAWTHLSFGAHRAHAADELFAGHVGVLPHVGEEVARPLRVADEQHAAVDACAAIGLRVLLLR